MLYPRLAPALLLAFLAVPVSGAPKLHMISDLPAADYGTCLGLKKRRGSAEEITHERIRAVVQRLRDMNMNGPQYLDPLRFNLITSGRSNAFGGNRLALSMLCLDQFSNPMKCPVATGTVAHEIGHWVGHTMKVGGRSAYEAFRATAYASCHGFDGYSTHFRDGQAHGNDLSETFAEVFAGYVTAPEYMKKACPSGYEFMRTRIFRGAFSACGEIKKEPVPLPRPRPAGADLPEPGEGDFIGPIRPSDLPQPGDEGFIGPVLPSADGEHDLPAPGDPDFIGPMSPDASIEIPAPRSRLRETGPR